MWHEDNNNALIDEQVIRYYLSGILNKVNVIVSLISMQSYTHFQIMPYLCSHEKVGLLIPVLQG